MVGVEALEVETEPEPVAEPAPELDRVAVHAALDRVLDAGAGDDPAVLMAAMVAVGAVRAAVDGAAVAVVSAFESSMAWADDGHRSPVSWMVVHQRSARVAAAGERRVCLAARQMPHVSAAARGGVLPGSHLRLLVGARRAPVEARFDRDEADLVAAAVGMSADELRRHLDRWYYDTLAELGENEPENDPGGSDHSTVRLADGFAGRGLLDGDLCPEDRATLAGAITAEIERWRRDGGLDDDPRSWHELQADALLALVSRGAAHPGGPGLRPSLLAVVDVDTLLRRSGLDPDERTRRRAEILGVGPVSDATIRELASRPGISLLVVGGGRPLWLGRSTRLASAGQRAAVFAADGGRCYWPGCDTPAHRCQIDHLVGWEQHGTTDIDNLGTICGYHNRLKHRRGDTAKRQPDGTIEVRDRNGRLIGDIDRGPP